MTTFVRACSRCVHALKFVMRGQIQPQLQCRWGPPAVLVLPKAAGPGQIAVSITPFARPVPDDYWCRQFAPLADNETVPIESQNVQNVSGTSQ
jgi:hypothetical protein